MSRSSIGNQSYFLFITLTIPYSRHNFPIRDQLNLGIIILMITRELHASDQQTYNDLVNHPLQSWEWGEFRLKMGLEVIRIGTFDENRLISAFQFTLHNIPRIDKTVGYLPKGPLPVPNMLQTLRRIGNQRNTIFFQLEPNVLRKSQSELPQELVPSKRPLFTKYTFHINLTLSEEELLSRMSSKTRYNIRLAQKHGVTVSVENTQEAFLCYLELTRETTKRQEFYAHNDTYHRLMWEMLSRPHGSTPQIAHILVARYQGKILATWVMFLFNGVLYYPYGASTSENKDVMASNLLMWEAIRFGKAQKARLFDLWGTPGANPTPLDPYYGFHRFKLGYGPELVEFVGSYDLMLQPFAYRLYAIADRFRWLLLKTRAHLQV